MSLWRWYKVVEPCLYKAGPNWLNHVFCGGAFVHRRGSHAEAEKGLHQTVLTRLEGHNCQDVFIYSIVWGYPHIFGHIMQIEGICEDHRIVTQG